MKKSLIDSKKFMSTVCDHVTDIPADSSHLPASQIMIIKHYFIMKQIFLHFEFQSSASCVCCATTTARHLLMMYVCNMIFSIRYAIN